MSKPQQHIIRDHRHQQGGLTERQRAEATAKLLGITGASDFEADQQVLPPAETKPRVDVKTTPAPAPAAEPYNPLYLRLPSRKQELQPLPPGSVVLDQDGWARIQRMIDTHPDVIAAREQDNP